MDLFIYTVLWMLLKTYMESVVKVGVMESNLMSLDSIKPRAELRKSITVKEIDILSLKQELYIDQHLKLRLSILLFYLYALNSPSMKKSAYFARVLLESPIKLSFFF